MLCFRMLILLPDLFFSNCLPFCRAADLAFGIRFVIFPGKKRRKSLAKSYDRGYGLFEKSPYFISRMGGRGLTPLLDIKLAVPVILHDGRDHSASH